MLMSSTTLVPVEEYLRYSDKPNCEYRDGVLYPKPMPTTFHGLLEFMLVSEWLRRLGLQAAPSHGPDIFTNICGAGCRHQPVLQSPYPTDPVCFVKSCLRKLTRKHSAGWKISGP